MNELSTDIADFAYPYKLQSATFITRKEEYKPQIFAILQAFSLPLWIAVISLLILLSLVYYIILKRRYSFHKIIFHVFAVLLRQNSILKPSSVIEKLLVFSWVVGAMFLCLAYDSVFLFFLSFPPTTQIKDVLQLAKAVKEGHYHCIAVRKSALFEHLLETKHENLRIIGQDVKTNNLSNENSFQDFFRDRSKHNIAFIIDTDVVDILNVGKNFISEENFLEHMSAMIVRKNFCWKKLLEKFVHRLLASGIYFKYRNDAAFLTRMPRLLEYEEEDTSKRKLTLTDVAPAFIFLIFGHIMSFLVLIAEIVSNRMKKVHRLKEKKKRKMRIAHKEDCMYLALKM